ncbi:hypothetical protein L207DRAFT_518654 [Hyaloscypha variabilis F]|jgi:hypothetical protein|uniref:Uncharacterized protein n=1 Tax=Hyaloscypha variabilis (strain UAMH 11265 / GT02V1 / F) TaxID=1149755 RepID=A0A2J6R143_HYAVF|nr:hypothetical protein L207DRAFT_518654 [Hyaloscypha variabilis F]
MKRILVFGLVLFPSAFLVFSLKIASALNTIEYTPELIASKEFYNETTSFVNGGVANIVSDTSIDLAANAETQALRQYAVCIASPSPLHVLAEVCKYRHTKTFASSTRWLK